MFAALRRLALSAIILALAACATQPAPAPLAEALTRDAQLSTFNRLVEQAGLKDELRAAGPLTVFAPSDEAFKAVPAKTLESLNANKEQLKAVLRFHIVAAKLAAADIKPGNQTTLQGAPLMLARAGDFVTVEEAMVQRADLGASNGVAHVIDRVLMPPKK
ncbi:fasciclin domain-containing protein [Paucibacter sp. APW11]|uniref:Fasciclin domain-containing protein n=1 Tax=Roseateles aquae TaxID=3077235 RepID=A0ABU3P5X7_9BURK|nr:fasciclin domain-containing protein [Paucibacter sp. APW11]MDT8997992.1 fasciclin domain-containing protein [Paucibacter sp. APW11]